MSGERVRRGLGMVALAISLAGAGCEDDGGAPGADGPFGPTSDGPAAPSGARDGGAAPDAGAGADAAVREAGNAG